MTTSHDQRTSSCRGWADASLPSFSFFACFVEVSKTVVVVSRVSHALRRALVAVHFSFSLAVVVVERSTLRSGLLLGFLLADETGVGVHPNSEHLELPLIPLALLLSSPLFPPVPSCPSLLAPSLSPSPSLRPPSLSSEWRRPRHSRSAPSSPASPSTLMSLEHSQPSVRSPTFLSRGCTELTTWSSAGGVLFGMDISSMAAQVRPHSFSFSPPSISANETNTTSSSPIRTT